MSVTSRVALLVIGSTWLLGLAACSGDPEPPPAKSATTVPTPAVPQTTAAPEPEYVTTRVCAGCHPDAYTAWSGSHHELAMLPASETTIRGDFADAIVTDHGVTSRFFRRGEQFVVHTEGPDGKMADFEVRYTFGAVPLQQYLVELPGGRMHALTLAWDTRPADEGGQRWFSLHGDERVPPGDVLHWAGPAQRWNSMCASCHSTNVRKGFDRATLTYDTTWSDVNVGCEACHGPGSEHVAWAEVNAGAPTPGDPQRGLVVDFRGARARWVMDAASGIARRSGPPPSGREIDTCAPCHSRRTLQRKADAGVPFLDAHRPALLEPGLYHADGQILDEVYVWGSFVQSAMYRVGVTCGDCHEPHSLAVRGDAEQVCAQCHEPARFATAKHHHHVPGTPGARCVDCHMPARTYMWIDPRRDHGFRVPRPDLSVTLGTPNPCTDCHADRPAEWAASTVDAWPQTRRAGTPHFAETLDAARRGTHGSATALRRLAADPSAAAIVRATALTSLGSADPAPTAATIADARNDRDPLVRFAAAQAAETLPPSQRVAIIGSLLTDPSDLVRGETGRVLADAPREALDPTQRADLDRALATHRRHQLTNADTPSAHVNLGLLHLRRGETNEAAAYYNEAIRVGPYFLPAYVNLADLYRMTDQDTEGEAVLRRALRVAGDGEATAEVHHALGLLQVRQQRLDEALVSLRRASELAPQSARLGYVYGVALNSVGRTDESITVLQRHLERHPDDVAILQAIVAIHGEAGRAEEAAVYLQRLETLRAPQPRP